MNMYHNNPHIPEAPQFINPDINEILRGEISAMEAYDQVIEKVNDTPDIIRLREFKSDHKAAVDFWKKQSKLEGKTPANNSSIWGTIVQAFVGTSKVAGDKFALRALRSGEEHGLTNYKKMLDSDQLTPLQKDEIRNTFIPRQKKHIETMNALIKLK